MFQRTRRALLAVVLPAVMTASLATADGDFRTVVLEGQQAPGLPDGVIFSVFGGMDFNNAGQISLLALVQGPGFEARDNISIWDDSEGYLELVARVGEQAPGSPEDIVFSAVEDPDIDDLGRTTFGAVAFGPSITSAEESLGVWRERESGLERVGVSNGTIINLPANTTWGVSGRPRVTAGGLLTVDAYTLATGPGGQDRGVVIGEKTEGVFSAIIRVSQRAPGYEEGALLQLINYNGASTQPVLINDLGQTAFTAEVAKGPDRLPSAIFSDRSGQLDPVVREGDSAPGVDGDAVFSRFIALTSLRLSDNGEIAFKADIEGEDITPGSNATGIWSDAGGDQLQLVVQNKDPAAGLSQGVRFASLGNPVFGEPGQVYFNAVVEGGGIDFLDFVDGLWMAEGGGDPMLLLFEGDQAPGVSSGVTLDSIGSPVFNALGQYLVGLDIEGPGIDESNNHGLWAASPNGILTPIVWEGDEIDVDDDPSAEDLRTIETFSHTRFNDRGEIAFFATFTDGSSGLFISSAVAIPEPTTALFAVVAIFTAIGRGRRR